MKKNIVMLFFLGSLWGFVEIFLGSFLYGVHLRLSSVILTGLAFGILGISLAFLKKPGVGTIIALIAVLFRAINASPYYCHLLAIFLLGVGLDISLFIMKTNLRGPLIGIYGSMGAWLGYFLFAIVITYIIKYKPWGTVAPLRGIRYISINGTIAAFISFFTLWGGYKLGECIKKLYNTYPVVAHTGIIGFIGIFWLIKFLNAY